MTGSELESRGSEEVRREIQSSPPTVESVGMARGGGPYPNHKGWWRRLEGL